MLATAPATSAFDPAAVRRDFPILAERSHGRPLVYLDNGATTQKPRVVIDALRHYYEKQNANIHRGVYELSQIATEGYEKARRIVQRFVNAADPGEIIFTRGTTEAVNLVAASLGGMSLGPGDEVLVSALEHHSNIVPWQMICRKTGAVLRVVPMNDRGELLLDEMPLSEKTRIVAVTHLSNALGTVVDVEQIIRAAHGVGAKVLIDGAQWVAHAPTDVRALDADFYVFSGHKLFGPTGIGVLYGKRALLEAMPPYQGGGDMIETVSFEQTTYADLPNKFEAGTPSIAGAIGLSRAIEYVQSIGLENIRAYEREMHGYLSERIGAIEGVRMIGTAEHKASVVSFVIDEPKIDHYTAGTILDMEGIAVRTGHHCCMPVMTRLGITGTIRASIAMYNTRDDVDALATALEKLIASGRSRPKPAAPMQQDEAVRFPEPSAASPDEAAAEIVETLELFDDWQQRYQVIIELGEKLLPMTPEMKNEVTRVHGCQSTVHLFARKRPGTTDAMDFLADSDADLVRGLIAILQKVFAGQSSRAILAFDVEGFFARLGLDQHLTMGRRNGLAGMVQRIRAHANQLTTASG